MNNIKDLEFLFDYAYMYCAQHLEKDGHSKEDWKDTVDKTLKQLKAWNIVRKKQVNLSLLLETIYEHDFLPISDQVYIYNSKVGYCEKLTQRDYKFLKEVLL